MTSITDGMTLDGLLFWISFIFCLALTAGGMMLIFRYAKLREVAAYRYLQYYMVLIYIFGFYVLWSELFLKYLPLTPEIAAFSSVVVLLGTPFLLVAGILQLLLAAHLADKKPSTLLLAVLPMANLSAVYFFLQTNGFAVLANANGIYAVLGMVSSTATAVLLLTLVSKYFPGMRRVIFAGLFLALGLAYTIPLAAGELTFYSRLAFAFLFFFVNTLICAFFIYKVNAGPSAENVTASYEAFVKKYGITGRELEIIKEIYNGKSNQEIADSLFVTLQTVKDHTSRIYQKTDVKSRAQLVTIVRNFV